MAVNDTRNQEIIKPDSEKVITEIKNFETICVWKIYNFFEIDFSNAVTSSKRFLKLTLGTFYVIIKENLDEGNKYLNFCVEIEWCEVRCFQNFVIQMRAYNVEKQELFCRTEKLNDIKRNQNKECVTLFEMNRHDFDQQFSTKLANDIIILEVIITQKYLNTEYIDDIVTVEKSISDDILKLYGSKDFTDVTIQVRDRIFEAHQFVMICRSDVFKAMFGSKMVEKETNTIIIDDITPEVFEELLRYMYTDNISDISKASVDICIAADKYGLNGLKTLCENELKNNFCINNVVPIFNYADSVNNEKLKKAVVHFIAKYTNKFSSTDLELVYKNHTFIQLFMNYYGLKLST